MSRATTSPARRKRKKKVLKLAKGFWGDRSKRHMLAKDTLRRAMAYAYRDRRVRRREFRALWITRISAACRLNGTTYARFIQGLKKANVILDRKMISQIAIENEAIFKNLIQISKG